MTAPVVGQPGIVDSHQHFWDLSLRTYGFITEATPALAHDFLPADLAPLMAEAGVTQTVLVQAHHSIEEGEWLLSLTGDAPWVGGVVAWVDLAAADVGEQLDRLAAHPKMKGVRHLVENEDDNAWLLRPDVGNGLAAVAERGLSYDVVVRPRHMRSVPEIARRHPDLRIVVDHIAKPRIAAGEREPWGTYMRAIAACPNVWCKVSGLVTEDDPANVQVAHMKPFVDAVVRLFGFERLLFGSDWPVSTMVADYARVLEVTRECVAPASDAQLRLLLADNARDFYRLGPPA